MRCPQCLVSAHDEMSGARGDRRPMDRPLAATRDPALADELARLAAAAGARSRWRRRPRPCCGAGRRHRSCSSVPTCWPSWSSSPRRAGPGVQVVAWSPVPTGDLPRRVAGRGRAGGRAPGRRGARGRAAHRPRRGGPRGGRPGRGGRRLGWCRRHDVRVRARPGGRASAGRRSWSTSTRSAPGCDRVLALDEASGVRWDSLGRSSGRLSGRSLREAVPRRDGLGVLSWPPGPGAPLDAGRGPRGAVGRAPRPRHGGGRPATHASTRQVPRRWPAARSSRSSCCRP